MSFPWCYRWLSVASLAPICDHTFPKYCKQHAGPSERSQLSNSGPSCRRNSKGCSFWGTVIGSGHRQRPFPAFVFFWLFVMSTRVLQFFSSQSHPPQSKDVVKGFLHKQFFREVLAHAVVFGCCADRLGIMSHPLHPCALLLSVAICACQWSVHTCLAYCERHEGPYERCQLSNSGPSCRRNSKGGCSFWGTVGSPPPMSLKRDLFFFGKACCELWISIFWGRHSMKKLTLTTVLYWM